MGHEKHQDAIYPGKRLMAMYDGGGVMMQVVNDDDGGFAYLSEQQ